MMKGNRLLITILICGLQACGAKDTTNPQSSNSINESKKNGLLIVEYGSQARKFDSLKVGDTWLEKIWYNENDGSTTVTNDYQLCFKIKQTPGASFQLVDVFDWRMREHTSRRGVAVKIERNFSGVVDGMYVYELTDSHYAPDSLVFDLLIMSDHKEVNVGNLVFVKKH
ncbi:hypothetical protein [Taibaiella chishuiensis]|uniref:Uncharacterized protein n=1 Tax=Taibaiella chishuiensis TaxID=1434707 RepID=A0A2P8D044_9BACT|nr:hypothetical protein [Taibaiella chishuiensis]PSK90592.1 hypothetical protein B0I18_1072 [Taibaiella chishuiensis]